MSELSSGTKGALAELRVAPHLIALGFEVARHSPCVRRTVPNPASNVTSTRIKWSRLNYGRYPPATDNLPV